MISVDAVRSFKEKWCDENRIIVRILKEQLIEYFIPPILDAGSGLGDIAYNALHDMEVICIDINYVSENEYPVSPNHERLQINFFHYIPQRQINTVLISHSLQFLDDDLHNLHAKICQLNSQNIVLVVNRNDGLMGSLLGWTMDSFNEANPEVKVPSFPNGYCLVKSVPFRARIDCPTFEIMAQQIAYMMAIELDNKRKSLVDFLKKRLAYPRFFVNQLIEVYTKNEE